MNTLLSKATRLLSTRLVIPVRGIALKFLGLFRVTEQDASIFLSVDGRHALRLEHVRTADKLTTAATRSSKVSRHPGLSCPYGPIPIGVHPHFTEIDRRPLFPKTG